MVMGFVVDFRAVIFLAGGVVLLLGVLRKMGCRAWFFAGEFVVECCNIVVFWWKYFGRRKFATVLRFIFG
jgi:hypothetical protein